MDVLVQSYNRRVEQEKRTRGDESDGDRFQFRRFLGNNQKGRYVHRNSGKVACDSDRSESWPHRESKLLIYEYTQE